MVDRARPRQERSRATVERLLAAANEEIAAHGTASTTTTRIAARAGVSVGALYRFFGDKEAIADALAQRYREAAESRYRPLLDGVRSPTEVPDTVRQVVRATAELQRGHPAYFRMIGEAGPGPGAVGHDVRSAMIETFDRFIADLAPSIDPRRRHTAVWMVVETIRHVLAVAPTEPDVRRILVEELADLVGGYVALRLDLDP